VPTEGLEQFVRRLRDARRVTVLTGAGVSAASGVPTFRGAGGLWESFRAEDLATPEAFAHDPRLVWRWYDWRRQLLAPVRPNAAHEVLAAWQRTVPGFTLLTQNVDGLHEAAGSTDAVRLHGSIWRVRCVRGCTSGRSREDRRTPLPQLPPHCACGALLRPDVVWFGEPLDSAVLRRSDAALACDLFVAVGTSALVYPAAGFLDEARARGAFTVEINPDATGATGRVHLTLRGPAEDVLPEAAVRLGAAHEPSGRP
jgi:NAD-dependent deacetylase